MNKQLESYCTMLHGMLVVYPLVSELRWFFLMNGSGPALVAIAAVVMILGFIVSSGKTS